LLTTLPLSAGADAIRIDIVDVGHGSCIAIHAEGELHLIDTGPGAQVLEYLHAEGIREVKTVLISHADADHIRGLLALLGEQVPIGEVIWNPDAAKESALWEDLLYELDDLDTRGTTLARKVAIRGTEVTVPGARVQISVLAPRPRLSHRGTGAHDRQGHLVTSNSMSAVVRVSIDGEHVLLAPGDLDRAGFSHLMDGTPDIQARYLVLPHHGGLMGTAAQTRDLVQQIAEAVGPEAIFVSNGRGRYDNPRDEVLAAVRAVGTELAIHCTQLSEACSKLTVLQDADGRPYSAGHRRGLACAATTRLTIGNGIGAPLDMQSHAAFIAEHVPQARCQLPHELSPAAQYLN
jgi:beta-lactamase superfamily II metal-dependent hydrolase